MRIIALCVIALMGMMGCRTREMVREAESERVVGSDSCGVRRMDASLRSVTDVTIIEYDNIEGLDRHVEPGSLDRYAGSGRGGTVRRVIHIKRRDDLDLHRNDSATVESRDSLRTLEVQRNKSSPDKVSQGLSLWCIIILFLTLLLAIVAIFRFSSH